MKALWADRSFRIPVLVVVVVVAAAVLIVGLAAHTAGIVPVLAFGVLWWAHDMQSFDDQLAAWLAWESA